MSAVQVGSAAAEPFVDRLMINAEAAKAYGLSPATFETLVREGRGPWTFWSDDVRRGAKAHKAGGPK